MQGADRHIRSIFCGSVSCPRTIWHAGQGKWTGDAPTTRCWLYPSTMNYSVWWTFKTHTHTRTQIVTMYYNGTTQVELMISPLAFCCWYRCTQTPLLGTCSELYSSLCSQHAVVFGLYDNKMLIIFPPPEEMDENQYFFYFYSSFLLSFVS